MKKILIICQSNLHSDPRVIRQYEALKDDYEIHTLGFTALGSEKKFHEIVLEPHKRGQKIIGLLLLLSRYFSKYLSHNHKQLRYDAKKIGNNYSMILVNDIESVPIAVNISKNKIPIWADLHEYSPRQMENDLKWRIFYKPFKFWLCKKFLPVANSITTVGSIIGKEYERVFHIKVTGIITNAPIYEPLNPVGTNEQIRIIHHGAAIPRRKLDTMIGVLEYLPKNYELNLMLMASDISMQQYKKELEQLVLDKNLNVKFPDPVDTKKIAKEINKYDIGLFILEPVNFNYLNALPNKLFEFVQGRLAIAVSPNPEMKLMVEKYKLGVVSKDYSAEAMANKILQLTKTDIEEFKKNANFAAQELSADDNYKKIKKIAKNLIT